MSAHTDIQEMIAVYRGLGASDRFKVDSHVANCAACAALFARSQEIDQAIAGLGDPVLPARLRKPLFELLADNNRRAARRHLRTRGFAFAPGLAPALVAAIAIIGIWLGLSSLDARRSAVTPTPTLTVTPTATTLAATLKDGILTERHARAAQPSASAPWPVPVPVPQLVAAATGGVSAGEAAHSFEALQPRATIVR